MKLVLMDSVLTGVFNSCALEIYIIFHALLPDFTKTCLPGSLKILFTLL